MATHSSVLAWRIPGTGGAWWAAVYGVAQSWTRLKQLSSSSSSRKAGRERGQLSTPVQIKCTPEGPCLLFRENNCCKQRENIKHCLYFQDCIFHIVLQFFKFLFLFRCSGLSLLSVGFLSWWRVGAALPGGAWASHLCWLLLLQWLQLAGSRAQAQQLWHTELASPSHVEPSWTRDQTCVSCICRQILIHQGSPYNYLFICV